MNKKLKNLIISTTIISIVVLAYFFIAKSSFAVNVVEATKELLKNDELVSGISVPPNSAETDTEIQEHRGYAIFATDSATETVPYELAAGNTGIQDIQAFLDNHINNVNSQYGWYGSLAYNTSVFCQQKGQPLPGTINRYLHTFHVGDHEHKVDVNDKNVGDVVTDIVERFEGRGCKDKHVSLIQSGRYGDTDVETYYEDVYESNVEYSSSYEQHTYVRLKYEATDKVLDTAQSYIVSYSLRNLYKHNPAQVATWMYVNNATISEAYSGANAVNKGTALKNAAVAVQEVCNPTKPSLSKGTNTGTVLEGSNYKVGPIHISDYTYAWCEDAAEYSGELICGIVEAKVELDNGKTITLNASNFNFTPTYQNREGSKDRNGKSIWRSPLASDGYFYPTPDCDFYILLPYNSSDVIGATKINKLTMKYKYTTADGTGWNLKGEYTDLTWIGKIEALGETDCTYDCDDCHHDDLPYNERSASSSSPNYKSHAYWCGATGYCDLCEDICKGHQGDYNCECHTSHSSGCYDFDCNHIHVTACAVECIHEHGDNCYDLDCPYDGLDTHSKWVNGDTPGCFEVIKHDNYCEHGHEDGKHDNSDSCTADWGEDHKDKCYGPADKGTICEHNHSTCYYLPWEVTEATQVDSQYLFAVKDAQVHEKTFEIYIADIPLVTKVEINKYIYDVEHTVAYSGHDSTMSKSDARGQLDENVKKANPVYAEYGDLVTYKIALKNHSAFAVKVRMTDVIPQNGACTLIEAKMGTRVIDNLDDIRKTILQISAGNTISFTITIRVERTNGTYVNTAKIITRNGPIKDENSDDVDYIRTVDDNGPVVNHSSVTCNGTTNEPKIISEDWYTLNDYVATLDKYVSKYYPNVTEDNNAAGFTKENNADLSADGTLVDRYPMSEQEKFDRPLQVEQTEIIEYGVRITNEAKIVANSVAGATKKQTTVRPTKITDTLQIGLNLLSSYARIYTADGSDKYNANIPVSQNSLGNNTYSFEASNTMPDGRIVMLDPGEYIVYYLTVEVEESNMYLHRLVNTATLNILTNINDTDQISREVQNENGVNENKSTQQVSNEYVKLKDLVIAGKVWLDTDKDGFIGKSASGTLSGHIDAAANISTHFTPPTGNSEYAMKNIVVKLYRVGETNPIRTTRTDENGLFTFGKREDGSWYNGTYSYDGTVIESEQRIDKATNKDPNKNYDGDSRLIEYYIEYEYDGLVYKSTVYAGKENLNNDGTFKTDKYKIDSNAAEFKAVRDEFDLEYEVIGFDKGYNADLSTEDALSYQKEGHNSWIKQNDDRVMTARSFIKDVNDMNSTEYLWLFKQATDYDKPATDYLKYINLGLEEREDVDISITHDVYEVKTTVNGEQMTYEYNQNDYTLGNAKIDKAQDATLSGQYDSEFYMTGYRDDNSVLTPYEFRIYNADYNYKKEQYSIQTVEDYKGIESELNIETTYRIKVTNNGITEDEPYSKTGEKDIKVYTGINEIVQYYDTEFVDLEFENGAVKTFNIKTKDANGYLVNTKLDVVKAEYVMKDGTRKEVELSDTSKYNTRRELKDKDGNALYSTLYIRPKVTNGVLPLAGDMILAEGESVDILITFNVDKEADRNVYLGDKINVAEISAYSTYYKNENGAYYAAGLVDRDSNPGNFGELYSLSADKNVDSQEYLALFEDDTFKTGISMLLQTLEKERLLRGFVWDDSRSETATNDDGVQYIGDGKYDTSVNAEQRQPKARRNQSVSNKEVTDIAIKDMKTQLIEMIAIPERDASGNVISEKVYEQTISANTDSIMSTRTNADGKYELKGYIPGEYIVRFFYGDDVNLENMLIFNGQDYKSTTYQVDEPTYAENITDPDKALAVLEKPDISDAKDDEIRRLETISYSETMTNNLNTILRGKNSTNKTALIQNTHMNGETAEFLVKAEKELSSKKILSFKETMEKFQNTERHPIVNIDFGIEYRPELQVALNKYISNVKIVTSDENSENTATPLLDAIFNEYYGIVVKTDYDSGATEFLTGADGNIVKVSRFATVEEAKQAARDAGADIDKCDTTKDGSYVITLAGTELDTEKSIGLSNLQYVQNEYEKNADGKLFLYDSNGYVEATQGFVYLNIDDEIMQGATISIKYVFAGSNLSEIDRVNSNLSVLRFKENDETQAYTVDGQYYNDISIQLGQNTGYIDLDYSGAMTARNKLFSEYYRYELVDNSTAKKDKNGNDILYRVKDKKLIVESLDTEYYGRYLGQLYYTGEIGPKDIVAELKIDKIVDYVDNDLVFDNSENNSENNLWKTTTSQELLESMLISEETFSEITLAGTAGNGLSGKYILDSKNRSYDTAERSNLAILLDDRIKDYANPADDITINKEISKYLLPRYSKGAYSYGTVKLVASKVISPEELSEDMNYENIGEIVQYSSVTGRVTTLATTLGNVSFKDDENGNPTTEWDESLKESDTAATEEVTLTPPTGLGKVEQIIRNTVEGASYTVIIIIAVAVVCVGVLAGIKIYRKRRIK